MLKHTNGMYTKSNLNSEIVFTRIFTQALQNV